MSVQMLDAVSAGSASQYTREEMETLLAASTEELAGMRFSVLLTAQHAGSENLSSGRRAKLRSDLQLLRRLYYSKIDEIAMKFGVQQAMGVQEQVERKVTVPRGIELPASPGPNGLLRF